LTINQTRAGQTSAARGSPGAPLWRSGSSNTVAPRLFPVPRSTRIPPPGRSGSPLVPIASFDSRQSRGAECSNDKVRARPVRKAAGDRRRGAGRRSLALRREPAPRLANSVSYALTGGAREIRTLLFWSLSVQRPLDPRPASAIHRLANCPHDASVSACVITSISVRANAKAGASSLNRAWGQSSFSLHCRLSLDFATLALNARSGGACGSDGSRIGMLSRIKPSRISKHSSC